jgi:epoxyqueuosine reductase
MVSASSLVLHVCCAPDEAYVVKLLKDSHRLHCYFSNPNIAPREEYDKRLSEARRVAEHFGVPFDSAPYEPRDWERAVQGLEHTPEGAERCRECFLLRFRQTAAFCKELGCTQFTSVMSISPHKRIAMLNEAGATAAAEFAVSYATFDFKKQDGFLKSIQLSRELGLYRQDYCGCSLSKAERDGRKGSGRAQ